MISALGQPTSHQLKYLIYTGLASAPLLTFRHTCLVPPPPSSGLVCVLEERTYFSADTRLAIRCRGLDHDYHRSRTVLTLVEKTQFATHVRPHFFNDGSQILFGKRSDCIPWGWKLLCSDLMASLVPVDHSGRGGSVFRGLLR